MMKICILVPDFSQIVIHSKANFSSCDQVDHIFATSFTLLYPFAYADCIAMIKALNSPSKDECVRLILTLPAPLNTPSESLNNQPTCATLTLALYEPS
ncbi:hypothetical protein Bca101_075631 [Brassica carinata]